MCHPFIRSRKRKKGKVLPYCRFALPGKY